MYLRNVRVLAEEAALSDFKGELLAGDGVNQVMWERGGPKSLLNRGSQAKWTS